VDHGQNGILTNLIFNALGHYSLVIKMATIALLIYQAIQINRLVSLNRLTVENSLFAGVFYLLILSLSLEFIPLQAPLIANTFIIVMLMDIFKQTRNVDLHLNIFNVGLWAGLASLFYFPYIIFFPAGLLGVIYLRSFKSIDLFRALLGLLIPYFLVGTCLFLFDRLPELWTDHIAGALRFLDIQEPLSWKGYTLLGFFGVTLFMSLASLNTFGNGLNIHVRRKISVLMIILMTSLLLMVLVSNTSVLSLLFLSIPVSVFLAIMFLKLEPQFGEVLHFLILAIAIAFQYLV
jgi:hypothetical protein